MARLLYLADACRKSGLKVVEVAGWKTRGSASYNPTGGAIIVHHTATSAKASGDYPSLGIVRDGRAGLPGPLSQLGLGRSGTVYVIASGRANHAGNSVYAAQTNSRSIGIEAEHSGQGAWTSLQYDAYVRLVAALCQHYGKPVSAVYGHKESATPRGRKVDPNFSMDKFRADVTARIKDGDRNPPAALTQREIGEFQAMNNIARGTGLAVDGIDGPKTAVVTRAFQADAKLPTTGVLDRATLNARRALFRLPASEVHSPERDMGTTVPGGVEIAPGSALKNGAHKFALQGDGHLVLYSGGRAIWSSGARMDSLHVQRDGKLIGRLRGWAVFEAGKAGPVATNVRLSMQSDRNVVLYRGRSALWHTKTNV